MHVRSLDLPEVFELTPAKHGDGRGFFSETYNAQRLGEAGLSISFVQDNHSYSAAKGVLRGLHFQMSPRAQDKLVRVVKGSIFDVAVDIRRGSPRFGMWCSLIVSAERWNQILVPKGFAHGFLTLEDNTEVIYKTSDYYAPDYDRAIRYDDPTLGIDWPLHGDPILSAKDQAAPVLRDIDTGFTY